MRILIIQENGRHAQNRSYRECHSLAWSFRELGHEPLIWGLGHSNLSAVPDFDAFDAILNLENYDQTGWLPELSGFQKPVKLVWAVDEHVQPESYYKSIFERDRCDYWLHSTRDYVKHSHDIWMPNAVDPILVRPLNVQKRAQIGFCGHVHNRAEWLHVLRNHFAFQADVGVIGRSMVQAINSYEIAFNRNIANDINARNFEVTACGIPLLTGFDPQYEALGFKNEFNCMFYESKEELIDKTKWLLKNPDHRQVIARNGLILSQSHTYTQRAKAILELVGKGKLHSQSSASVLPDMKVSICVITNSGLPQHAHRVQYLQRLIASVELAGFPAEREIIIAGAIPESFNNVRRVDAANEARDGKVCALRNRAVELSTGKYIVQCDDDIVFTPGYWPAVNASLDESEADILCTRLLNPNGRRYWDWAAVFPGKGQTLLPYEVSDGIVYATGGHAVYKRTVFNRIRWDETLKHGSNEEFTFADQAHRAGLKFSCCPQATVFLQYFHCDAQSAAAGVPPVGVDDRCDEFLETLRLCTNESRHTPIRSRFSHKIVSQESFDPPPKISILVGCYRYLQRFRIFAQSILAQDYPKNAIEVVVANPTSPDGLSAYLKLLQNVTTEGPFYKEATLGDQYRRNRGYMIQRAFELSAGQIVIGMDCDLILPPNFLRRISNELTLNPDCVVGVYRRFLSEGTTARILTGELDSKRDFGVFETEDCEEENGYRGVLGYCQAVNRHHWEAVKYPEEFDNIAISDVKFNERLQAQGVKCHFVKDLTLCHLHHPRNWEGTTDFL